MSSITICLSRSRRCFDPLASTSRMAAIDVGWSSMDLSFRRLLLLSKLFTTSWGDPKTLENIDAKKYYVEVKHDATKCNLRTFAFRKSVMGKGAVMEVIERLQPNMIITKEEVRNGIMYVEGRFASPYGKVFPEMMPDNIGWACWRGIFPKKLKRGLVIHLAGTGDHSFFSKLTRYDYSYNVIPMFRRREWGFANDLIKQGISSVLLENPFYGSRKPKNQFRFLGYAPLGLSGVSMGGHMASLACTNSPKPVALVPCLSWTTAAPVFVEGALSGAIPWEKLTMEFKSKRFQSAIHQIPQCDWIERAYEMNKRSDGFNSKFGVAKMFMYILMEEFTNLGNYPTPFDTTLVKNVIAEKDAYVVRNGAPTLQQLWPGSNVEVLKGMGHVYAYLANHHIFRKCIIEMLNRSEHLYGHDR
ncbi:unnamed protein product [Anisakis simplex]|uniref:AB hydrolase-1 domain-containing protein n=1 Tax=Anisakis simplex TaxID=6269 RepID=A0A158PN79_ANISI|nr:unnamed protein product [Anisakis simplex]